LNIVTFMKSICLILLLASLVACAPDEGAERRIASESQLELVTTAKQFALQDAGISELLTKYPDLLDQPARLGATHTDTTRYHTVTFRKENPRGAAQFLEVQINEDMTLRGFRKYKLGY
jgi:hypothetical protein